MASRRIRVDHGLPRYHSRAGDNTNRKLETVSRFNIWLEFQQYTSNTRKHYCKVAGEACLYFGQKPRLSTCDGNAAGSHPL